MAKYTTLTSLFTAIANSLRTKTGSTGTIVADDFPSVIDGISIGITPTGTKKITTNGTHSVTEYANAEVNVPVGTTPTGTKEITTNGTHDVANYANANVNVPIPSGYIKPSGTKEITANGTHDVTNYASANVNVPSVKKSEVIHFSLASDLQAGTHTLVSGNDFIKNHRADSSLVCMLRADTPATGVKNVSMVLVTNKVMAGIGTANTGVAFASINGTSMSMFALVNLFTAEGYNQALYSDANGNLKITLGSNRVLVAGNYTVYLTIE